LLAFVLVLGASGCSTARSATLTGRWVMVANDATVGVAQAPQLGAPLALAPPAAAEDDGCTDYADFRQRFGATCEVHESESRASPVMSDDVPLGNQPTAAEVLWYCDEHTIVRFAIMRCGAAERFKVMQMAVSTR
jgi:hypothetical protein